ncbi:MAG: sensor domain-containing diguanylate cyclase [Candidatus Omnitrophota bacterium]
MHKLILLVCAAFIYTISLLLASGTKDYYFAFSLCVIPIAFGGYFYGNFTAVFIVSFCSLLGLTLIQAGVSGANFLQSVLLFIACGLLTALARATFVKNATQKQDTISLLEEKFKESELPANQISERKFYLDNKVSEISNLYHTAKKLGSCATSDDLLTALRDILAESFKFSRCEFITLYDSEKETKIDKIFQIGSEKVEQVEGSGYEDRLLKFMLRKKQLLVIDSKVGKIDAEEFIFPEHLNTFIAAPIISAEKINAILAAEDIDLEQVDHFVVATNQLSMALERVRLYELVQEMAITDDLTKVFVRRHLMQRLNEELTRAELFNARVSLLMIDIDDFKEYNDRYGHLKGDLLLERIALMLKNGIREIDIIGRYGGEEFCIVLPDTDLNGAELVANRLRKTIETLDTTISIGLSTYPDDAKAGFNLIEKADKMLYRAKSAGKNRVCRHEEE